ncbi:MAG: methyl-accepting chemotaxis protein [Planctomycetota bacterium]
MSSRSEFQRSRFGLTTRVLFVTGVILAVAVAINYLVFMSSYRDGAERAMVNRAASLTSVADETMSLASGLLVDDAFAIDELFEEAQQHITDGGQYRDTRYFRTLPVIMGRDAAAGAAEREGLDLRIVAKNARNMDNAADPGSFRASLLDDLREQALAGEGDQIHRIDPATNSLHVMRAIRLNETCMSCHGDPAIYDERDAQGQFDGLDALGFRMEGWEPGDIHGAYELVMPMAPVDAELASVFTTGMMYTLPIVAISFGGFVWGLRRMLGKPLGAINDATRAVADGDLTKRIEIGKRGDEVGALAGSFNSFLDNIHELIGKIQSSGESVAAAAQEISASAAEMSGGLASQESQTSQVAAAIEEMTQNISEVSTRGGEAQGSAEQAEDQARKGGDIVRQTIEDMNNVAKEVQASAQAVGGLGERSEQIGEIVGVIEEIADQTNLLALNAAIEAARAGEHGRGFAVVADEVRKLAERTTSATEQVTEHIRMIQSDTGHVIEGIESGRERASSGAERAQAAGDALDSIVRDASSVRTMISSIASACDEQSSAAKQVSENVVSIAGFTQESSSGAAQMDSAAADLAREAEDLKVLLSRFTL